MTAEETKKVVLDLVVVPREVPKDFKEVVDLIDALLGLAFKKAGVLQYKEVLEKLYAAIDGIGNVDDAVKGQWRDECMGYLVERMTDRVLNRLVPLPKKS